MKYLYKYPQAEFPYARLVEENRRRDKARAGVRAGRHRDLRRGPLLRRRRRVRQGRGRGHPDPHQRQQPRPGGGADRRAADALVPQHLELGARRSPARRSHGARDESARSLATHWELGEYALYCSGADELLFTENETNTERLFGVPSPTPYVKDAFHAYVVDGRREAVNPAAHGNEGGRALHPHRRRRRDDHARAAPGFGARRAPARGALRRLRRGVRAAQGGGGRVLRRRPAGRPVGRCPAGGAPGLRRDALVEAVSTTTSSRDWLEGDPAQPSPAARAPARAQPRLDAPLRPRRDLDARQVGVPLVRRRGTSASTASPSRTSTRSSPRSRSS